MSAAKVLFLTALLSTLLLSGCGPKPTPIATDAPPAAATAPAIDLPAATVAPEPTDTEIPTLAPTEEPTAAASLSADQLSNAEELLNTACAACHSPSKVTREHGDLAFWQQLIHSMRQKGAEVSDDDALLLAQYLAQTYP